MRKFSRFFVLPENRDLISFMNEKVGIGIIGTGFARKVQIPAFLECEGARIVSVASHQLANAESTAREFGIEHFTDNWRETVENEAVDLVCITTPPASHYEITLAAIETGKHVLCEKPMAMYTAEALEMTRRAAEKGVLALIDHEKRFQDGRLKAFEMLRSGEIGKIRHVKYVFRNASRGAKDIAWNWWSDKLQGGGALGAIGSHAIDALLWLTGAEISQVYCQLNTHVRERKDANGNWREVTTDDETMMLLRFADTDLTENATGSVSLSMVEFPDYQHSIEFVGTTGSLKILHLGEIFVTKAGEKDWTPVKVNLGKSIAGIFDSGFPSAFLSFAPKIIEAIQKGKTEIEHAATFEDGVKVQKVIDAAHEANETGCSVKVRWK